MILVSRAVQQLPVLPLIQGAEQELLYLVPQHQQVPLTGMLHQLAVHLSELARATLLHLFQQPQLIG